MPINLPGVPSKLNAADMGGFGGFDVSDALSKGFNLNKQFQEAKVMPKELAERLLNAQLQNKINKPKADYAEDITLADLANTRAGTQNLYDTHGMSALNKQLLQQKVNQGNYEQNLNDSLFGSGQSSEPNQNPNNTPNTGVGSNGTTKPFKPNTQSLGELNPSNNNQNVVNQGNPSLYHIDEAYNNDPRARKYLESKGFKKSQTTKYDPKTGITSTITTEPSGKVTVTTNGVKSNNGTSPLTTKARSTLELQKLAIPQLKDLIKKLKNSPSPFEPQLPFGAGNIYRSSDRANYQSLINTGKDLFVKSKGVNATDKTLETGEKVLARGTLETDDAYHKRLDELDKLLDSDNEAINKVLSEGVSTKSEDKKNTPINKEIKKYNPNDYNAPAGSLGMYKNGELFFIPSDKAEEALAQGYTYE